MMLLLVGVGLLFLVGLVFFILYVVGRTPNTLSRTQEPEDEALATLRKRFAAGEISRAEFEEMKQALENPRSRGG
jgi:uncharacterized membrane protein